VHPADHPGPLVLVDDLDDPELADGDRHHLERVLRVRPGDAITVADGRGRWRTARFGPAIEPTGAVVEQPEEAPPITVGFALVKGDKPETIVQKLTELGVDRIVPFRAERSVVRWDDERAAKAVGRLRAVARAAAMQSHRPRLPVVEDVSVLDVLATEPGVALADRSGDAPALERATTILVGPEGGWTDDERRLVEQRVVLGGHVLRAETAAITAGVVLTALRARLVGPAS
jgi:16S rRNA (uracil1498-N3)-methyltransferase